MIRMLKTQGKDGKLLDHKWPGNGIAEGNILNIV